MMKTASYMVILAALVLPTVAATAQAGHSFEAGLGMPRGYMDVSANGFLNLTLLTSGLFRFQPVVHESFAAKKSEGDWLAVNVLAGYGLLRYDFRKAQVGLVPYIAAGGGLHFMTSHASGDSPVNDNIELKFLAKAHGFVGAEYSIGGNKLLSLKARFTYPSDLIFDAAYLNYGIRF